MLTTSSDGNNAVVVALENVRKHPNADRVQLATVVGDQVVVGLGAKDGDVMVYFSSNLVLSPGYLSANNLYSNPEMNVDETKKGYFGKSGRVRAQRFRGEMSHGFVAGLETLVICGAINFYDELELQPGEEFTHINGMQICEKYIVPVKSHGTIGSGKKVKKPVSDMFWKHWDTKHLLREKNRIPNGIVYIEEKIHGTSARTANVLFKSQRPWWKFWAPKVTEEWRVVSGTRRVDNIAHHASGARGEIEKKIAPHLRKGEQAYYEIFGHDTTGKEIQSGFSYGCSGGKYRVILYRVTITTPDGYCVDLPREAVYRRADELGLERPPLLGVGHYINDCIVDLFDSETWFLEDFKQLAEGKSTLDANTIREGIVVWFMTDEGNWSCLKLKSEEFLLKEDKQREKGIGDIEDSQ
jgi:hypothetical protein